MEFKSIFDFIATVPDEASCVQYLEEIRWAGIVVSPFDETSKVYKCKNGYKCKNTGKYFNVKVGTIFEDTKIPLTKWFMALFIFASHKNKISSYQLAKEIDITQKAAWVLLGRLFFLFKNIELGLWSPIKGYEGYFEVSNKGEVRSVSREAKCGEANNRYRSIKGIMLKQRNSSCGYKRVSFKGSDGVLKTFSIHRLVAEAFIPNKENLPEVNHKDGDKTNNHYSNLEWVTSSYNQIHAFQIGLQKGKQIEQLSISGKLIKGHKLIVDASRELLIPVPNIIDACAGRRKTAGGFKWRYAENI